MSSDNPLLSASADRHLQERIARVPAGKGMLFEQRAKEEGPGRALPLSFAQQRLWLLDQLEPGLAVYNIARAFRMAGALDVSALEQAFNEIVRRHEALRTTFVVADGQPVQVIAPHVEIPLPMISLREGRDGEAQARRIASEEARRPFDLARGPLMRAVLLRLSDRTHILLLTIHHIVSDAWSMGVFFTEMAQCYSAFTTGRPSALPELPIQYADFATSQREQLQGEKLDGLVSYWKERLKDPPARLELPGDRPRPRIGTSGGATHTFAIDRKLTSLLEALSRRESVTLFMTLIAGFQALLYRWAGVEDVIVGAPIAGRASVETERLIGFFVNTLVLRTSLAADPTVRELLARVRETALGAYDHQDLPFEYLVELLRPERSRNQTPLLQVMFALQNVPRRELTLPGLALTSEHVDTGTAKFDLTVSLTGAPEGLAGRVEYNTDIFEARTIERLAQHFQTLLAGMVDDPERHVSTLPVLTPAERRELLFDWNDTLTEYPRDVCLHQLFERQVERAPDAVAVVDRGQELSYRELNRRANQLAHRLQAMGVGPDGLVAVCVDRSAALIVGLLAILKAGGGYVPLDPRYPQERLALMMADARVRVLLTDTRLAERLPVPDGVLRLLLDRMDEDPSSERDDNPSSLVTAEDTAYVMYTSGSTGRPKGVVVPHRAVTRLVINTNYISLQSSDIVAQAASCSFDTSTFEIWGALLHGARLALVPEHVVVSPTDLAAELTRQRVTVLVLTTAVFNMVGHELPGAFNTVADLLVAGDVIDPTSAEAVLTSGGPRRLLNAYGPTEATTFASWYHVTDVRGGGCSVPIGRPLANTRLYVLDAHLEPVPVGTLGEIYIGGDALARGYLNDPDLTSERFVPDPFSAEPRARLYKTGDIGRFLADGNIEFLGRRDQQIKIRGFRVEPGEIQSSLDAHPLVRESLVIAREDHSGDKRLVAYVVPATAEAGLIVKLRVFARERLPEYMVPSAWVLLGHLPLTINGKLDRAALPAPDGAASAAVTPDPPRDAFELGLRNLWEDLLEQHPIGMSANFFELGGHSLLAARLCASIERAFGTKLPLATFFQAATIQQQAELLRSHSTDEVWPSLVPIRAGRGKPPLFCVHGVGGNILTYRELARYLPTDQPVYCLQASGLDGKAPIHRRIEDMAGHYIAQTRQLQPLGPYAIAGMSFGGVVAFEMARQLEMQGQRVALLALFDSRAPTRQTWLRRKALEYGARASFHARNLVSRPDRGLYIHTKVKTIKRRLGNRFWQIGFRWRRVGRSLPRAQDDVHHVSTHALRTYRPQAYQGRVTLFRASEYPLAATSDPRMGWGSLAMGGVEIHDVPGNHFDLVLEPHVQVLAGKLARCLDEAWKSEKKSARSSDEGSDAIAAAAVCRLTAVEEL